MATAVINDSVFSNEAQARLREPKCRGMFRPIDAARRQLGLLTGADAGGQYRLYCLVDLETKVVEDARFLAFGDLRSHPVADAFTELIRNKTLDEALSLNTDAIAALLRGDADAAFGEHEDGAYDHIAQVQADLKSNFPSVKLLPKPVEKEVYKRKREADWTEFDQRWFPLSLLRKIGVIQKCIQALLDKKLKRDDFKWSIEGLHDDFKIEVKISEAQNEEIPTLIRFMEEAVREGIHPDLSVEEHN